jgi:hypothetical protein
MISIWAQKRKALASMRSGATRTHNNYDCDGGAPHNNLRAVKWGPNGGAWEKTYACLTGPPPAELRSGPEHCWLCNAALKVRKRQWTRPCWQRVVTKTRKPNPPCSPKQLLPAKDGERLVHTSDAHGRVTKAHYISVVLEPQTKLPMSIFLCPHGCDTDDALQPLLKARDHTGPAQAKRVNGADWYERTQ